MTFSICHLFAFAVAWAITGNNLLCYVDTAETLASETMENAFFPPNQHGS